MRILVNIDVPDLEHAIDFYHRAFGLTLRRRLGPKAAEMLGAEAPIYLLEKAAGTPAAGATRQPRDYARHWTPVHLDVVVEDADRAVQQAVAAGARLEDPAVSHAWGRIAHLSDPYGHGICILQFLGRGYDEVATPQLRYSPVSEADFEDLLALRIEAMRESLERLGRFDPQRARSRLRSTFRPEHTWSIERDDQRIGFYALRPDGDGLRLDHLYIRPAAQGLGLGAQVLGRILQEADSRGLPVSLSALRDSDSNRFYRRHGFVQTGESEWDIDYLRPAPGKAD
ncbi:GNAT family N-acetyltransferase [Achromobacter sp. D10]|uniref:GNAT family N-acetyltransferase n=1 Tax=Achromobacter sp. D10 TaxID=3110765 RepID=UPI002B47ACA6|nr:GNAT family N-acetyltransferase [Achromobacter sp. D10]MEB3099026.1 GNAT family N-acetyltransferase [Achromobacter sp. D10]